MPGKRLGCRFIQEHGLSTISMPTRQAGSRESALYGSSAPPAPLTRARCGFSLSWTIVDPGATWPSRASLILPEVGFPWPQTTATMFLRASMATAMQSLLRERPLLGLQSGSPMRGASVT